MSPTATLDRPGSPPVDPRIQARREQVVRRTRRRRLRRMLALLVVISIVAGAYAASRSALLDVDHLVVHGASRTSVDDVLAAVGVQPGQPLFDVDAGAARAAVRTLPWVADAAVRVHWNGDVEIFVFESEPFAYLPTAAGGLLVDAEGRALAEVPADQLGLLSLVRVEGVAPVAPGAYVDDPHGALALARGLTPGVRTRADAVIATAGGTLDLRLRPSGVAWLGRSVDLEAKLRSLTAVLAQVDLTDVEVIDVRVPDQPVVRRLPPPPAPEPEDAVGEDG